MLEELIGIDMKHMTLGIDRKYITIPLGSGPDKRGQIQRGQIPYGSFTTSKIVFWLVFRIAVDIGGWCLVVAGRRHVASGMMKVRSGGMSQGIL